MNFCPLIKKKCIKEKCAWWTEVTLRDIATQKLSLEYNCAVVWLPQIMGEQNRNTIGVAAAVEARGNDIVKEQGITNKFFANMAKRAISINEQKVIG
jgi:hypothetical protein